MIFFFVVLQIIGFGTTVVVLILIIWMIIYLQKDWNDKIMEYNLKNAGG